MLGVGYVHGIFSFENLLKWFNWPMYGAPLPCQKKSLQSGFSIGVELTNNQEIVGSLTTAELGCVRAHP